MGERRKPLVEMMVLEFFLDLISVCAQRREASIFYVITWELDCDILCFYDSVSSAKIIPSSLL